MTSIAVLLSSLLFSLLLSLSPPARAHRVIAVSDGDSITLLVDRKPLRIRLANIDAPELSQAYGRKAKQSLSGLCWGKDAQYAPQAIDRYGRTVAVVHCDGVEANRAQVEHGMAWTYAHFNQDPTLPALERDSRAQGRGLWAAAHPVPPWEYRHAAQRPASHAAQPGACRTGPRGGRYRIVDGRKRYDC